MTSKENRSFDEVVERALARIPQVFREAMRDVAIIVEDWPDPELASAATSDGDQHLYGLFDGIALTERSFFDSATPPPVIFLYREPLQSDFHDREELERQVEITLVHEIGHFMGFDDDDLEKYGYG